MAWRNNSEIMKKRNMRCSGVIRNGVWRKNNGISIISSSRLGAQHSCSRACAVSSVVAIRWRNNNDGVVVVKPDRRGVGIEDNVVETAGVW